MKKMYLLVLIFLVLLVSCKSQELKDGTYTGKSTNDDRGSYGSVTIKVKDNKITNVDYVTYQKDGSIKDENYGKQAGSPEFYEKAQIAVKAMQNYADQLLEKQNLSEIDCVSGATISYNQFLDASYLALDNAK